MDEALFAPIILKNTRPSWSDESEVKQQFFISHILNFNITDLKLLSILGATNILIMS